MTELAQVGLSILGSAITTTVPIALYMASNRKQAKKEIKQKHDENKSLLTEVLTLQRFHPPHSHPEKKGPLLAENLMYPPAGK